ncbi:hypothetical protein [Marinicella sp. W31]|uniref:hypothetical protein n=1 Tax=Marinicella sp. W31 TaxID=3023713 RepID=UPI0037566C95
MRSIQKISKQLLVLLSVLLLSTATHALTSGKAQFMFSDWQGPPLRVWTYIPEQFTQKSAVVFVMHGTKRDGERYRNEWTALADQHNFLVVVPEFPKDQFPGSRGYNLGNVFKKNGQQNDKGVWSFSAIEPLFDAIKKRTDSQRSGYAIYGHSAGSQFVHRFLYHIPEARLTKAVAANAGWYTLPDFSVAFPYGLKKSVVDAKQLKAAFEKKLVVLLGTEDTSTTSKYLRKTPEAMAQGAHRFARGQFYFKAGQNAAQKYQSAFNWRLELAPGVGHKNGLMAQFAAPFLLSAD